MYDLFKEKIAAELKKLRKISGDKLVKKRRYKFQEMGVWTEE
jgi:acetyl-CoA carboxylase alpha subunit